MRSFVSWTGPGTGGGGPDGTATTVAPGGSGVAINIPDEVPLVGSWCGNGPDMTYKLCGSNPGR